MSIRRSIHETVSLAGIIFIAGIGCQTLHEAGVPGLEPYLKKDPEKLQAERSHRDKFIQERDHEAFYWLLSHKISNGMHLGEVEDVFGEPGEYTDDYKRLKSDGQTQLTDSAYRWGPDNKGFSAVLFFRDGRLINFDRSHYAESSGPKF